MESLQLEIGVWEQWSEDGGSILGEGKISSLLQSYTDLIWEGGGVKWWEF